MTGAIVTHPDGRAVWRRLNCTVPGVVTATQALSGEIFGIAGPVDEVCFGAVDGRAAMLLRAGGFTANVSTQPIDAALFGP